MNNIKKYDPTNILIIVEDFNIPYRNVASILDVRKFIANEEHLSVLFSDDLILGGNSIQDLKLHSEKKAFSGDGIIAVKEISRDKMCKFGNVLFDNSNTISFIDKDNVKTKLITKVFQQFEVLNLNITSPKAEDLINDLI